MFPRSWRLQACVWLLTLGSATIALADDSAPVDARLEGYRNNIAMPSGSTAIQWLELVGLGVVCMGVMFINARRSHLD